MSNLTRLDATNTLMSTDALTKFAAKSKHSLKLFGKIVEKKGSSSSGNNSAKKKIKR